MSQTPPPNEEPRKEQPEPTEPGAPRPETASTGSEQGHQQPQQNQQPYQAQMPPQQPQQQQAPYGQGPPQQGQPNPYGYQGAQRPPQQPSYQQPWGQQPPAQAGYRGGPPPFQAPPARSMKRSPIPLIIGVVVLLFVGLVGFIALIGGMAASGAGRGGASLFGDKIAVLDINGVLGEGPAYGADTQRLKDLVDRWTEDDSIKGMVVRINSPGGAVSATQDLYKAINDFRAEGKPVYSSMGDVAASGGYYVAMGSDRIYSNTGTLTGSIGVILNFWGYQDLLGKLGLEARTVKSGEFKDIGSGARDLTEEERVLLDLVVDSVFEEFYEVVHENRAEAVRELLATRTGVEPNMITDDIVEEHLREYTDGRIFSGHQAIDYGMVDEIGSLDDAIDDMKAQLGITGEARIVETPQPTPGLFGLKSKIDELNNKLTPGMVTLEFRFTM